MGATAAGVGLAALCVAVGAVAAHRQNTGASLASSPAEPVPWVELTPGPKPSDATAAPLAGTPIKVELFAERSATAGEAFRFVVRLVNAGDATVSLEPCPNYRVQFMKVVETGYLNCAAAPAGIASLGHVDFDMRVDVRRLGVGGSYPLLWQLGTERSEGATGRVLVSVVRSDG
jgi:hypothetical protein